MNLPKVDDWTVDEIKDALRDAPDIASVNATATHYAREVRVLEQSSEQEHRTMAIQIKNLARYRRTAIAQDQRRGRMEGQKYA